jgi:hypothetical protein
MKLKHQNKIPDKIAGELWEEFWNKAMDEMVRIQKEPLL